MSKYTYTGSTQLSLIEEIEIGTETDVWNILSQNHISPDKGRGLDTPLHVAVTNGKYFVVERLLQYDADMTLRDANGETARDLAVRLENDNIVKLFDGELARRN